MNQPISIQIPEIFHFLREPSRYKVLYGGRGGAKSHNVARMLLCMAMEKKMRIVCGRELQKSLDDSVHALLSDLIYKYNLEFFFKVQKAIIVGKNGSEFKFMGLKHNVTGIKSLEGIDILWIEEAENVSNHTYEVLLPTLRRDNSEIWITFNVKNITDPTYQRFVADNDPGIKRKKVNWRDNPFFPEVLNKERLKLKKQDPEAYEHVWEGEPDVRRTGAIYSKSISKMREEGRVTKCPYDPRYEVFTAWDIGFADATAIWFLQYVGRELHWIDYYENNLEYTPHYVEIVKSKPYRYRNKGHFVPHDAGNRTSQGSSVLEMKRLGLETTTLKRTTSKKQDRDAVGTILEYSVFDAEKTKDGLFALESYHYRWSDMAGRYEAEPYHDWSSHGADAARYAVVASKICYPQIKTATTINSERTDVSNNPFLGRAGSSWMSG